MRECSYCKKTYSPKEGPICPYCKTYTYNPVYDDKNEERRYADMDKKYYIGTICFLSILLVGMIIYSFLT